MTSVQNRATRRAADSGTSCSNDETSKQMREQYVTGMRQQDGRQTLILLDHVRSAPKVGRKHSSRCIARTQEFPIATAGIHWIAPLQNRALDTPPRYPARFLPFPQANPILASAAQSNITHYLTGLTTRLHMPGNGRVPHVTYREKALTAKIPP